MAKWYFITRKTKSYDFSKTVAELLKLPHFKNLETFVLEGVSESFDIDTFFDYLKKSTQTDVFLEYDGPLDEDYKQKLQAIVDEMLDAESPKSYKLPLIKFDEMVMTYAQLNVLVTADV